MLELWGIEDLQAKREWLGQKIEEYNRLDDAYEKIQNIKGDYKDGVKNLRKDIFKDGWFKGDYDWEGSKYQEFKSLGSGDVKTEVEAYYKNGSNGLDDIADALLDAKADILKEVNDVFFCKFGFINNLQDLFFQIGAEINSLLNF